MDAFLIRGGQRLSGSVTVSGSKNSALPILAVSLMTEDPCRFRNVPAIRDIQTQIKILNTLGVETITLDEFLSQMGYRPEDRTVVLGSGARSRDFKATDDKAKFRPRSAYYRF